MRSFRSPAPALALSLALALPLGLGLLTATPATSVAALAKGPAPVKLAPLPKPQTSTAKTKAGTAVPIWMWPGSEWTGSSDWSASSKISTKQPATGEVVLIVFDSGDGVSVEPVVQMLRAMGATVVAFDNPIIAFDNPIIAFEDPLIAFEDPGREQSGYVDPLLGREGGRTQESPEDVVHAMITWASTHAIRDNKRHRVTLFGVGRGADLALKVGAKRTDDLRAIVVDNPSYEAASKLGSLPERDGFAGVRVVRASSKLAGLKTAGVSLAPDSMTYPNTATVADLASDGSYQRAVAEMVAVPQR